MAEINEILNANASGFIDAMSAAASAVEGLDAKFTALRDKISTGFAGAAGPDKLAAQWKTAAAEISASAGKIAQAQDRIGKAGAAGDAAAAGLGKAGEAGKAAAGGLDSAAASAAKADGALKGAGDAGKAAGEGLDLGGAGAARFAESMRAAAGVSADASLAIARSQKILADAGTSVTTATVEQDAALARSAKARSAASKQAVADAEASAGKYKMAALGTAAFIGYGIDMAAKLQTRVTRLYTSAGESKANLPMMTSGILSLSGQTATSQDQLGQGAYMVESAGYHGKDALTILRAAAQGAQAEGAPLGEVGNALTSLMTSYHMKPSDSIAAMNQIITMVGSGKMTMQGAVSALPQLLPASAMAGLSFGQAGGALATMTQTGMSPDQAAQNLRHTIGSLQGPNSVQGAEMYQLGLDPVKLAKNLGKTGLTGTVAEIQAAVSKHTDKQSGLVQLDTMNASKAATADALTMLRAMPPALQTLGKAYLDNSITQKQWMADLKGQPPLVSNLGHQFAATANTAHGFNAALKSGQPTMQTSSAALQKLLGGTVGFQTFLMLSGQHLSTFRANAEGVSAAARDAGTNVKGWEEIQKTFNFQLGAFKYSAEAAATTVGTALLPAATTAMSGLAKAGSFLAGHKTLTTDITLAGGALGLVALGRKLASPLETALQGVGKVAQVLKIPGLDKLANIGGGQSGPLAGATAASTGLGDVAASADAAAGALSRIAGTGGVPGLGGVPGKGKVAGEAAAAEEGAAGAFSAGAIAKSIIPGLLRSGIVLTIGDLIARALVSAVPKASPQALKQAGTGGVAGSIDRAIFGSGINNVVADINKNFSQPLRAAIKDAAHNAVYNWASPGRIGSNIGSLIAGPRAPATGLTPGLALGMGVPGPAVPSPGAQAGVGAAMHGWHIPPPPPVKIPAPDMSALNSAKGKAQQAIQGITQALQSGSKPAKVAAPDLSQVEAAKGKATAAANGIHLAMQNPLIHPVHAAPPNLSAFAAARGAAQSDGVAISQGLAAGIQAGAGAAIAAAQAVASQVAAVMRAALQTHSPSKVTEVIGADAAMGVAVGLHKHVKHVKHAARAVAMSISASLASSLATGLQGGQSAVDAAMAALGSPAKPQDITTITATVAKLQTELDNALKKKIIGKPEHSALTKFLEKDNAKLQQLAAQRTALEQQIADAQQTGLAAISGASIMNAQGTVSAGPPPPVSPYELTTGMQAQADQAKAFAQQVQQLKGMGLNATSLDQIIQAGATQGLPVAQGITSGGKGEVGQLNQLQKQIMASAGKLSDIGGPAMYQAGQDAAAQMGKGLKSSLAKVDSEMKSGAQSMVNAVKSAVSGGNLAAAMKAAGQSAGKGFAEGIESEAAAAAAAAAKLAQAAETAARRHLKSHSPSLLFRAIGYSAPQGMAGGMTDGTSLVTAASGHLASAAQAGFAVHRAPLPGFTAGGLGGGGGTVVHNHYNVTVQGSVHSENGLLSSLQGLQLERASNNYRGGWAIPYKAA